MLSEKNPVKNQFFYPWEQKLERLITPFEEFIHRQTTSGIMLMAVSVLALAVENSPLREGYEHLIHMPLSITLGSWSLERSLVHWINEGLMAFFFFVVGLEIKREVLVGELSAPRQAALPIIAAIGGMVVPALIYFLFNQTEPWSRGWGIPMATDIAFCVGALVLLGNRVPQALMIFLVSLAIVDDLGAVVVIAVFYTEKINIPALGIAACNSFCADHLQPERRSQKPPVSGCRHLSVVCPFLLRHPFYHSRCAGCFLHSFKGTV